MTVTRETPASKQWPDEVAAMGTTRPVQRTSAGTALTAEAGVAEPQTNWTSGRDVDGEDRGAGLPPGFDRVWMRLFFGIVALATVGIGVGWYFVPHGDRSTPVRPALHAEATRPAPVTPQAGPQAAPQPGDPTAPSPQPGPAAVLAPASGAGIDNRPAAQIIAESTAPQELVMAAIDRLDQGNPFMAVQLLLHGDTIGWAPASLELGRMYDPTVPHKFDLPAPDLGYAVERYMRARSPAADPQTAQDASARLDAIRIGLEKVRETDPAAAAALAKYFR